jgi:ubiquinone/menaquinone biosynthesis C-methylase UbiE
MHLSHEQEYIARLPTLQRLLFCFLRAFFKLLYHQFAWAYDFVASIVSLGNWNIWVQSVLPHLTGPAVLEIGFGPGHLLGSMQQQEIIAVGLDESRQMAHLAQRRLLSRAHHADLVRGNAMQLPFAVASFHQVVMTFPSEYLLHVETLMEIWRVLVIGGSTWVLPYAWITGRKPLERLLAWLNRITGEAPEWNPSLLEPLKRVGFEVSWQEVTFHNSKLMLLHLIKV